MHHAMQAKMTAVGPTGNMVSLWWRVHTDHSCPQIRTQYERRQKQFDQEHSKKDFASVLRMAWQWRCCYMAAAVAVDAVTTEDRTDAPLQLVADQDH